MKDNLNFNGGEKKKNNNSNKKKINKNKINNKEDKTITKKIEKKNKSIIFNDKKSDAKKKAVKKVKIESDKKLKIIPLGGLDEIGKNLTVFEYGDEIIIVDCGLAFPEQDMLGIDVVIPDFTYLTKNASKVKAIIITHGHEDHIGGIPYILKELNIPIYASKLTIGLINNKLQEHNIQDAVIHEVKAEDRVKIGKNFNVEFIHSAHSIPDPFMLAITTPVGTVVHTGDFKVEFTPVDGKAMDIGRMAAIGNKGVLALLSDSTNAEKRGFTMSEKSVGEVFDDIFTGCKKRIIVATFASNVARVQQIIDAAIKNKRKIALSGRSMINMVNTARKLKYIDVPDNTFIEIDQISNYKDEELTIITTGSQGEPMSALTRMAAGQHKLLKTTENDLVIISANPIPGNEIYVSNIINLLMKTGAEVVYSGLQHVHVSGHACQEEQKLILSLFRPKYFLPVHGEYKQLIAHKETAKEMGMREENVLLMKNGMVVEIDKKGIRKNGSVPYGKVFVDGLGVGDVGNVVLRDRQHLSQDGLVILVMKIDSSTGELIGQPDIISRGFVYIKESEELINELSEVVTETLHKQDTRDWTILKGNVRSSAIKYIFKKTERNPMVLPIIVEV